MTLRSFRLMAKVCWRWLSLPHENRFSCALATWFHASLCLLGILDLEARIVHPQSVLRAADRVETVAGTGRDSANGREGSAEIVNIGEPFGVEVGPDGGLYVTEVKNHRIWRMDLASKMLTVVAGNGTRGYSGDGGLATDAQLNEPYEVRFDADGNMYFVEMMNHLIRRVDRQTQRISTVAGAPEPGFAGDGGPARSARFRQPHSIVLDGRDGLWIADIGNHRIRRIDLRSGMISTVVGNGEKALPKSGIAAAGQPILGPRALFIDGSTLWIGLREGNSIWSMNLDSGILRRECGTGQAGYAGDGEDPLDARLNGPKGIAVDRKGRVLIVDTENQVIRAFDPRSKTLSTLAGSGKRGAEGADGDGGDARNAEFDRPHGIGVGPDGVIYVGDTLNHRVRKIVSD
ncbi:MAG: Virginiamycin lyase [Planctomycetota bacterium]|jgi:streptogramin lyase